MKKLILLALILLLGIPAVSFAQVGNGGWYDSQGNYGSFWYNPPYQGNSRMNEIISRGGRTPNYNYMDSRRRAVETLLLEQELMERQRQQELYERQRRMENGR